MKIQKDCAINLLIHLEQHGFTLNPTKQAEIKKLSLLEMAILEDGFNLWFYLTTLTLSSELAHKFFLLSANIDLALNSGQDMRKYSLYDIYQDTKDIKSFVEFQHIQINRRTI